MFNIGFSELILILVVALVVFGPDKLPEVGKTLGKTVKEFKAAVNKIDSQIKSEVNNVAEATGMEETLKDIKDLGDDLKKADSTLKDLNKELKLKDISKIDPFKSESKDLQNGLKKADDVLQGLDKELKDISKIDILK